MVVEGDPSPVLEGRGLCRKAEVVLLSFGLEFLRWSVNVSMCFTKGAGFNVHLVDCSNDDSLG